MDEELKIIDPPVTITVGDEDVKGYSAPNNTVAAAYVLPAKFEYKVTAMSTKDPRWIRVDWKTTGQGGQVKYDTVWAYLDENSKGVINMSGKTAEDKSTLSNLEVDIKQSIGVGSGVDNSASLEDLLERYNADTLIYDDSSYDPDIKGRREYVVTYTGERQQNLGAMYEQYLVLAVKAYGAPPQSTPYADPRIMSIETSFGPTVLIGRKFADVIVSNPTILSLCPGVVKYNQILADAFDTTDEDSIVAYAQQAFSSNKNGKICEFQPCWYSSVKDQDGYIKYVNMLNRVSAIAMSRQKINDDSAVSLADRHFPGDKNGRLYREFDWIDYDNPDNDVTRLFSNASTLNIKDFASNLANNVNKAITDLKNGTLGDDLSKAIGSYKYINFYCSGNNSVSEQFETSVRSSTLDDMINGQLSSTIKEISFYTGGLVGDAALEDINQWANETSKSLGIDAGLLKSASEMFSGGRIVFPQIVDDCTYGKECQFTVRFIAGSGNCEARYLMRCEFNHLLAFILPKQLKGMLDMYTTPFLVRAVCRGRFSCEMGVLTNVRVTYGGQDDMAWTADGQPTEIEVSFSITPLYSKLYMTSCDQIQGMFLKNTGMMEYLLVNSAVDLRIPQLQMKMDIVAGLGSGYFTSKYNPENLYEKIYNNKFTSSLREIMNF